MVRQTNDPKVVLAVVKGAEGVSRISAYSLQKAILHFYTEQHLYPTGVFSDLPCVQAWALKYAVAIKKLVPNLYVRYVGLIISKYSCPLLVDFFDVYFFHKMNASSTNVPHTLYM